MARASGLCDSPGGGSSNFLWFPNHRPIRRAQDGAPGGWWFGMRKAQAGSGGTRKVGGCERPTRVGGGWGGGGAAQIGGWGGGWGWQPNIAGWGEGLGVGVLALGGADFVAAGEPELDGEVVAFEVVAEEVGAVGLEPGLLVEVAEQGIGVAQVLDLAVNAVDVVELAEEVVAVFLFL